MKKLSANLLLPITVILTLFSSCSKDTMVEENPTLNLTQVAQGYASGAATRVEIFTNGPIRTGFTPLYIMLSDSISNSPVEDALIQLSPLMDMQTMKHSSPFENPASTKAIKKLFPCNVVFTMPSGDMGSWTIAVKVQNRVNNKEGVLTIPITVTDPAYTRIKTFSSKLDNTKYIVAYLDPATPKVGVNDMEIAVYKKKSMMEFPADSSLAVTLTPEMPTMGHGSPNNVNPAHIGKGHYKGRVNFTMTGLWQLNLDFHQGTALADDNTFFEVNF